jgi:hypothetical protein
VLPQDNPCSRGQVSVQTSLIMVCAECGVIQVINGAVKEIIVPTRMEWGRVICGMRR